MLSFFVVEDPELVEGSVYLTTLGLTLSKISENEKQKLKSKMVRPPDTPLAYAEQSDDPI